MNEAFTLYYTAFHEFEITIWELKAMLIDEIGEDEFKQALSIFKQKREERKTAGDNRTL